MESATICYIDRIPNEILSHILSVLGPPHYDYNYKDLVAARQVSQRFRSVVNNLDFWHRGELDFSVLFGIYQRLSPRREARYIKNVLDDNDLVCHLNRKSGWAFFNIETFTTIVNRIPELRRNTHKIAFVYFHEALNFTIDSLATFTHLTELILKVDDRDAYTVDLDAIVESCPNLEKLDIESLLKYCGSLAPATKLQKLNFIISTENSDAVNVLSAILPINSAHSLTQLGVTFNLDTNNIPPDRFAPFLNITHFTTQSVCLAICDILVHGSFKLTYLDITGYAEGYDASFDALLSIFKATSLKSLRSFQLKLEPVPTDALTLEKAAQLSSAIINLRHLESLDYFANCSTSWFDHVANLRNLKTISLYNSMVEFDPYEGICTMKSGC